MPASTLISVLLALSVVGCAAAPAGSSVPQRTELRIGDKAPDFWLKNQDQRRVSLSDLLGRKNVVLVFFPLAFTPV